MLVFGVRTSVVTRKISRKMSTSAEKDVNIGTIGGPRGMGSRGLELRGPIQI